MAVNEEEGILLGAWLQGLHTEDMKYFDDSDFALVDVFRLLKAGKSALEISKESCVGITELMKMIQGYSDLFYQQIKESWQRAKIMRQLASLRGEETDVKRLQERIDFILSTRTTVQADSGLADKFIQAMDERAKAKPVNYGLPTLDTMTNGLKRKELTAIAARPSVGKSAFALQVAAHVRECGQKVLFFPLEMSSLQLMERLCVAKHKAEYENIKTGKFPNNSQVIAQDYIHDLEKEGLFKMYEGISDIEKIRAAIRQEKPFLVVIDQLTQMKARKNFNGKREQFSYMTSELKAMAMKENVAIILLCQINRDAQNNEPTMANLKESGSIEEDSDNVILLHRIPLDKLKHPERVKPYETIININLAKQRSGATGEFLAGFNAPRFRFYEKTGG